MLLDIQQHLVAGLQQAEQLLKIQALQQNLQEQQIVTQ